jgi:hypothetical protein
MKQYTTKKPLAIPAWEDQPEFYRADLQFHGVGHRGDSYEGRVFLATPDANPGTPTELDAGYAGSFYVFGHGPCFGDEGHCDVEQGPPIHHFDYRRPHPLQGQRMTVEITEALRRLIASGSSEVEVTVVPTNARNEDVGDILHFKRLSLVTYD